MKRLLLYTLLLLLATQITAQNKRLRANLSYASFFIPEKGPYLETYLSVWGNSVYFSEVTPGSFQASVEVKLVFKQNDSIVDYAKYALKSPLIEDTTLHDFNFIDQQRFLLPNGSYTMEIELKDPLATDEAFTTEEEITIQFKTDEIQLSQIEFIQSHKPADEPNILTKNGMDLVPFVYSFYPEHINKLIFYTEIYGTDKIIGADEMFLCRTHIESFETGQAMEHFIKNKRMNTSQVSVVLNSFDLKELPSGNYSLVVEVRDRNNKPLVSQRQFFQRSNPSISFDLNDLAAINTNGTFAGLLTDIDTLKAYIQSLSPIATNIEALFIFNNLETSDLATLQQFFYNFWNARNAADPQAEWLRYKTEVRKVEKAYATRTRHGWDTDRGRVYLKYGPPNNLIERYNEPRTFPYEIWHYESLKTHTKQVNRKFVFYTRNEVSNEFQLIHSNAIGELMNPRWQMVIYGENITPWFDVDQSEIPDSWGNRANFFYNYPH